MMTEESEKLKAVLARPENLVKEYTPVLQSNPRPRAMPVKAQL